MRPLLARLLALFHRRQLDDELSDEMSAHLELSTADHVARGLSLEDARRAAALRFGGTLQTAEAYRDRQGFPLLESLWQDVRYAVRTLRRNPVFTTTAAATLALAIGAQTSVYCLIDTLFLRPPAGVTEAQRLVAISALNRGVPDEDAIRYPDYLYYPGLNMLSRDSARLDLIGQLKPARTLEEARAEMRGLASQLEAAHAESRDSAGLSLSSLKGIHPEARPGAARFARLLAATVTGLLAIACANLAGLLLARNTTRHKEIAIRLALGAGRGRIVRQLLFESVLLSVCGGVVGLLLASWGNVLLASYYGTEIDGVRHAYALTIDRAALLLTMAVATATGIAFGLLPAVIASRTALIPALKKDAASQGFRRSRFGAAFLVAQVSISVVLVIGAALLIHSVRTLRSDPGFDVEHVALFRMKPRLSGYDQEKASSYFRNVQRHLESLGEVESVAFVRFPPTLPPGAVPVVPVFLPGHSPSTPDEAIRVSQHLVTLGFFDALAIHIV